MEDYQVALEGIVEARRGEEQTPGLDAEHAFRADFVGRLQENLAQLEDQLKELNRNLLWRPFHSRHYHFVKKPVPELFAILRWVEI